MLQRTRVAEIAQIFHEFNHSGILRDLEEFGIDRDCVERFLDAVFRRTDREGDEVGTRTACLQWGHLPLWPARSSDTRIGWEQFEHSN